MADLATWGAVRTQSLDNYRGRLTHVIDDPLGARPLGDLRPLHVRAAYARFLADGMSAVHVRSIHSKLGQALRDAVKMEIIERNPLDAVDPPRPAPRIAEHTYAPVELVRLFAATEHDRFWPLWVLLGTTGIRLGEALGLVWSDISWTDRAAWVERTTVRLRGRPVITGPPKNAKSHRWVNLIDLAYGAMTWQQTEVKRRRLAATIWRDHDLIFPGFRGGYLDRGSIQHAWKTALEKAQLPYGRVHLLRHSYATNSLNDGAPILEVQRQLGHANATTTLSTYAHAIAETRHAAAARMERLLREAAQ